MDTLLAVTIIPALVSISLETATLQLVDNNECNTDNGGCEHTCTNTPGSYECSCNTGYTLDLDDRGCSRKKELVLC